MVNGVDTHFGLSAPGNSVVSGSTPLAPAGSEETNSYTADIDNAEIDNEESGERAIEHVRVSGNGQAIPRVNIVDSDLNHSKGS
jgi:hypothetical protein